jgi:ferredoxin
MAYRINDNCFACGRCYSECKNGAISEGKGTKSIINSDRCTECVGWYTTPRCLDCCFVNAPELDPAHEESEVDLLVKFKKLHATKTPRIPSPSR